MVEAVFLSLFVFSGERSVGNKGADQLCSGREHVVFLTLMRAP